MDTDTEKLEKLISGKLDRLGSLMNIQRAVSGKKNTPSKIRSYFKINRLAYRRFQSKQGFMHFRVSKTGKYADADIYYQPDVISGLITPASQVLELGFGQGANLYYLARRHPDAQFSGVDLNPTNRPLDLPNLRLMKRDYSDLSVFPDCTFDVVYGIETIVYSSDKDKVFREVYRVLKPEGVFIVYDYSLLKELEEYSETGKTAILLISKCGAGEVIESEASWEGHFASAGFRKRSITDLTEGILSDLKRIDRMAERIISRRLLSRFVFRVFPSQFVNNIAIGYLGYDSISSGEAGMYMEWIYEKP